MQQHNDPKAPVCPGTHDFVIGKGGTWLSQIFEKILFENQAAYESYPKESKYDVSLRIAQLMQTSIAPGRILQLEKQYGEEIYVALTDDKLASKIFNVYSRWRSKGRPRPKRRWGPYGALRQRQPAPVQSIPIFVDLESQPLLPPPPPPPPPPSVEEEEYGDEITYFHDDESIGVTAEAKKPIDHEPTQHDTSAKSLRQSPRIATNTKRKSEKENGNEEEDDNERKKRELVVDTAEAEKPIAHEATNHDTSAKSLRRSSRIATNQKRKREMENDNEEEEDDNEEEEDDNEEEEEWILLDYAKDFHKLQKYASDEIQQEQKELESMLQHLLSKKKRPASQISNNEDQATETRGYRRKKEVADWISAFKEIEKEFPTFHIMQLRIDNVKHQEELVERSKARALHRVNNPSFADVQRVELIQRIEEPDSGTYRDIAMRNATKELIHRAERAKSMDCFVRMLPEEVKEVYELTKKLDEAYDSSALVIAMESYIREKSIKS